jgi:hypothetical protein
MSAGSSAASSAAWSAAWSALTCILSTRYTQSYTGSVVRLASCVYWDRDTAAIPILADALDDWGDVRAANHLRRGNHPRGCFVMDQILGLR